MSIQNVELIDTTTLITELAKRFPILVLAGMRPSVEEDCWYRRTFHQGDRFVVMGLLSSLQGEMHQELLQDDEIVDEE